MHITGERRIPAPRERVWRSLVNPAVLQECVPGSVIAADGEGGLILSAAGGEPVRAQSTIREPFATLGWRIDPAGAATQMVLVRLLEEGVFTRLQYEVSLADDAGSSADTKAGTGQRSDAAAGSDVRAQNLRARIDQALARLVHTVAGPGEIGAGGISSAVQAATEPSAQPNASLRAPSGPGEASVIAGLLNPSVIGGVLFLIVLLFMVGLF
jgi:hypothetical protein